MSEWKVYAWHRKERAWKFLQSAPNDEAAELAVRVIVGRGVTARAVTKGQEMRGGANSFYRIKYLGGASGTA